MSKLKDLLIQLDESTDMDMSYTEWETEDVVHYLRTEKDYHRLYIWARIFCEKYNPESER